MSANLRLKRPHLRCGLCDMDIEPGEDTRYVDDERCHSECADAYHAADAGIDPYQRPVRLEIAPDSWGDDDELEEAA